MNGDAQFWFHQFFDDDGEPAQGVKVYRYAAGTSTLKDAWVDAGRSTVDENPSLGDSRGMVWFYGDGDYRLRVETSDGVLLYDWDQVRITADTATMWEGNYGTALPGATSVNQGQLFGLVDSTPRQVGAYINTGSAFAGVPGIIPQLAEDDFPAATEAGWLRRRTDNLRGLWHSASGQWISLSQRTVDVQEFGARGDGATDDTDAFQAALNAIDEAGGGVVNVPRGTYIIGQVTLGSNTWVRGAGTGGTTCKNTSDALTKGIFTNKDQTDGNVRLRISDLTIERSRLITGFAGNFNEFVYFGKCTYVIIDHIRCHGLAQASWSDKGGHVEGCRYIWITDNHFRGVGDNTVAVSWTGVRWSACAVVARNTVEYLAAHTSSAFIANADDVIFSENIVVAPDPADTPASGFELGDGCKNITVINNTVINCGGGGGGFGGDHWSFIGNYVRSKPKGGGFNFALSNPTTETHLLLVGNRLENCGIGMSRIGEGVSGGTHSNHMIVNNLITAGAIVITSGVANVFIEGNRIIDSPQYGILVGDAPGVVVNNNHVAGAGQDPENAFAVNRCGICVTSAWTAINPGVVRNNVSASNQGYGYFFDQPQYVRFLDNIGWNNDLEGITPAPGSQYTSDKLLMIESQTLAGAGVMPSRS